MHACLQGGKTPRFGHQPTPPYGFPWTAGSMSNLALGIPALYATADHSRGKRVKEGGKTAPRVRTAGSLAERKRARRWWFTPSNHVRPGYYVALAGTAKRGMLRYCLVGRTAPAQE